MKCVYCNKKVSLADWGKHSEWCEQRKIVRGSALHKNIPVLEIVDNDPMDVFDFDSMGKTDLIVYLEANNIEYDPSAKKSKLLKLAKGD